MKALLLALAALMVTGCSSEDPKVRQRLLEVAQWEDRGSIGPERELVTLLFHTDLEVRKQAVLALGRIEDPSVIGDLASATTLDTPYVRPSAAWSMGQMARQYVSQFPEQLLGTLFRDTSTLTRRNVIDGMGYMGNTEAAQFLQYVGLTDGNPSTRGAAALSAGRFDSLVEIRELQNLVRDQYPDVRWRAAWAFWRLRDARGKNVLLPALRDEDVRVRMFAARALGYIGDAATTDSLIALLSDPDWRVRNEAAGAIGRIGEGDAALDVLAGRLESEPHELVARTIAEALGQAGRPQDLEVLRDGLRRRSGTIWQGIINGAVDGYPEVAFDLVKAMMGDKRLSVAQTALSAVGRLGTEPARAAVAGLYPDLEPTLQGFALAALAEFGYVATEPFLDAALQSSNTVLAQAAVDALSRWPDTANVERWKTYWDRHKEDEDADFKVTALNTAGAMIDSVAELGPLFKSRIEVATEDGDRLVRAAAIEVMAKLGFDFADRLGTYASDITEDNFDEIFRAFKSNPTAVITTSRGDIEIELRYDKAPRTVYNFVTLAREGFYEGIKFHRVVPNFVIQAGDPEGTGWGGPGYTIRSQYNDLEYTTGAVGMASSGKDTEGSQFFITHCPTPHLDDRYTLFGYVTAGQDVVDQIRQEDVIQSITIRK